MKKYGHYVYAVFLLGTFMGVLMSMGSNVLMSVGMSYLFWACMLTPMLAD